MWSTDTIWFDICLITGMTAYGSIFFGHFELHTPKWRRALKLSFFIGVVITITTAFGREWTYGFIGLMLLLVLIVHAFILPSKGINGWTGEPKERYYELIGHKTAMRENTPNKRN